MFTYYDLVLGIIPLTFLGVLGAGSVAGIGLLTAITVASVPAAGLLIHAMFINPPIDQISPGTENRSITTSQRQTNGQTDLSAEIPE